MMKLRNIFKKISRTPKRYLAVVAATLAIAIPVAVHAGFGPDRPTFDWNVNPGTCDLQANRGDRCGSITPVFNSFVNTPSYGDERNFTRIAEVVPGQSPANADFSETKNAQAGKEYWVRTLVHNNANQNLNCAPEHRDPATNNCTQIDAGSPGIATGTYVKLEIAQGVANGVDVMTKVGASNATPSVVWDTATLANSNQAFSVNYVNGSAVLYNHAHLGGLALPDSITSANGTPIGYDQMNGTFPGCFDFVTYVYVKVKVNAPALKFEKLVRAEGEDSSKWRDELTAKDGDRVQFLLDYLDTGSADVNNIVLSDNLPKNLELVPGSVKWIDINHPAPGHPVPDALLFDRAGVLVGNYGPNGGGYIMFTAKVKNDNKDCTAVNRAFVRGDNVPEQEDTAKVNISDCKPTVPKYSCDLFEVTKGDHEVTVSKFEKTAVGGATFKDVTVNWNDNSTNLVTNNPVGQKHTFSGNGPFNIVATARFTVDGQDKTATSAQCAQVVSFTTPGTPPELPNTGTGDMIGIFSAVTIAGALVHRYILGRE